MDCKKASKKMQELLDGALQGREAQALREHLKACPACGRSYAALAAVAKSVAALPLYAPSPAFRARVLAARRAAQAVPAWLSWAVSSALALAGCGTAAVLTFLGRELSLANLLALLDLALDPARAAALLKLELVKMALTSWRLCAEVWVWLPFSGAGFSPAAFAVQLAAACALSGLIVYAVTRGTPRAALSSFGRSL